MMLRTDIGVELVCDASDTDTINKLHTHATNVEWDNHAILLPDLDHLGKYLRTFPEVAEDLISLADKPLNVILTDTHGINQQLIDKSHYTPFRIVQDDQLTSLLRKFNRPLLAAPILLEKDNVATRKEQIPANRLESISYEEIPLKETPTGKLASTIRLGLNNEIKIIRN